MTVNIEGCKPLLLMSKDILSRRLQWPQRVGQVKEQKTMYGDAHHTYRTPPGNPLRLLFNNLRLPAKILQANEETQILDKFFHHKKVNSGYLWIEHWKFQQLHKVVWIVVKATQETLFQ